MAAPVRPAGLDRALLREQIQDKYQDVAVAPETGFHFHTGRPLAAMLAYAPADVDWLPPSTVESFAGTGNPLALGPLPPRAAALGLRNVDVRHGFAEALPVPDAAADAVISNGVINLCPDKEAVLREIARVLKPGGRVQIADIVVHREVPQEAKDDIALWSG